MPRISKVFCLVGSLFFSACLPELTDADFGPVLSDDQNKKVQFITYGDEKFKQSRERIANEAKFTKWFSEVKIYTPSDFGPEFHDKQSKFIKNNPRGGGYYIWKPYVILKQLEQLNDGDFLVYLDAGCTINPRGKKRLQEYLQLLGDSKKGVLGFQMVYTEKCWTKADLAARLKVENNHGIMDSGQVMAGAMVIQKNADSMKLVKDWYDLGSENNHHYIDDSKSTLPNDACFKENRHDQSIFSLLIKMLGAPLLGNEIETFGVREPFWATRKRI
jgi:hypothetical protein